MSGPRFPIQTDRCFIRPFQESDIDDFMRYRNDMSWMKYQGFKGLNKETYVNTLLADTSLQEGRQFAIVDKENAVLIGDVYIRQEDSVYWIGYTIAPTMARQGYAFETVSALINMLKTEACASYIKASVHAENAASIALLKKLHFHYSEISLDEDIYALQLRINSI